VTWIPLAVIGQHQNLSGLMRSDANGRYQKAHTNQRYTPL